LLLFAAIFFVNLSVYFFVNILSPGEQNFWDTRNFIFTFTWKEGNRLKFKHLLDISEPQLMQTTELFARTFSRTLETCHACRKGGIKKRLLSQLIFSQVVMTHLRKYGLQVHARSYLIDANGGGDLLCVVWYATCATLETSGLA